MKDAQFVTGASPLGAHVMATESGVVEETFTAIVKQSALCQLTESVALHQSS